MKPKNTPKKPLRIARHVAPVAALAAVLTTACAWQAAPEKHAPPALRPLTGEVCNHIVPQAPITIATSRVEAQNPVLQSDGQSYALAYAIRSTPTSHIRLLTLDKQGVPQGEGTLFSADGQSRQPAIDGDGSGFYLSWLEGARLNAIRVNAPEASPRIYSENAQSAASGPWGALVWVSQNTLFFRSDSLPPATGIGVPRKEPKPLAIAHGPIEDPAIAWTGHFYAIVWSQAMSGGRQIMLQRVLNDGSLMGAPVRVSGVAGIAQKPSVVWTGWDFAIAWATAYADEGAFDNRFRIFFAVVPEKGTVPALTRQLDFRGSADEVSMATSGSEMVLAWVGSSEMGAAIFAQRIDKTGTLLGETIQLNTDDAMCGRPAIAFDRDGYAIAWHEALDDASYRIRFAKLACASSAEALPAPDADTAVDSDSDGLKDVF